VEFDTSCKSPHVFVCAKRKACIPLHLKCDGQSDCWDGSDEWDTENPNYTDEKNETEPWRKGAGCTPEKKQGIFGNILSIITGYLSNIQWIWKRLFG